MENKAIHNFQDNKVFVDRHNVKFVNGLVSYDLALTDKADMTPQEISDKLNGLMPDISIDLPTEGTDQTCSVEFEETTRKPKKLQATPAPPPRSKDWRYSLSIARDQGVACGSCWAFTTIAAIEANYKIQYNKTLLLSEQFLIDCIDFGCKGGHFFNAIEYVRTHGLATASSTYPYTDAQGASCPTDKTLAPLTVTSFDRYPLIPDEEKLKEIVGTIGPVAVGIDGSLDTFSFYSSGIYYDVRCYNTTVNHAVLIVGYGTEAAGDYWWIRNS